MKLLKSILTRHHGLFRLALLGGVLLWMGVSFASPAHAIPTTYEINLPADFSGTFTLDPDAVNGGVAFSSWAINTIAGSSYSSPLPAPITNLVSVGPDFFYLVQTRADGFRRLDFHVNPMYSTWTATDTNLQGTGVLSANGTYSAVPEPAATVLLAIGLLILAGSRWLPGRRERQQLG